MRKLILLLILPLMVACSKDDKSDAVTIEYIVENGNADGIVSAKQFNSESIVEIGKGANFKGSDKANNDFIYHLQYRTSSTVGSNFKLIVKANGKTKETYYLSDLHAKNTYVNEGKVSGL